MKFKNLCFLTYGEVSHKFGGLDRVTEVLADYFENNGFNVYFLSYKPRLPHHDQRQFFFPNPLKVKDERNIKYFNQFLKEKRIDILINQEANVDIYLPNLAQETKLLYLSVLHFNPNYITDDHFEYKFKQKYLIVFKKLFQYEPIRNFGISLLRKKLRKNYRYHIDVSDYFIMLSSRFESDLKYILKTNVLPENVHSINNPLTLPTVISSEKMTKQKVLLYVGRLECRMKRIDDLLIAWKNISDLYEDWTLIIVGGGPDESYLKKLVNDKAIPRVQFEGIKDPIEYYKKASIFCFSSGRSEGWGLVLTEAMHYGCVPIAYNSYASIKDIIAHEENGLLIPFGDNKGYENAMKSLMGDETLLANYSKKSIDRSSRFHIDFIGSQWIDLFNKTWKKKYNE